MSRSRRLSDAEIEIWLKVIRTVMPRPGAAAPSARTSIMAEPLGTAVLPAPTPPTFVAKPHRAPTAASYAPPVSSPAAPSATLPLTGLERRYKRKVAGGQVGIDDALDLHGMTQAEAHGALLRFLVRAQSADARLVLVVTGKGGRSRDGEVGVLRRLVPHWLRDRGLRSFVLGFEEAAQAHGGTGALYIRLRRRGG